MEQLPDTVLVERARAGEQAAFAELYSRYFDPVYDFLARMMRNPEEAADVAQDTFLKAMNAMGGLKDGARFKSWVFSIARNTALNRLEVAGRTSSLASRSDDGEEFELDVLDEDRFSQPEEAAEASAAAALVWQAAAALDPKQYSLLDLHVRQGLESAEIADVLGISKNAGYVTVNRLKKAVEGAMTAFLLFKDGRKYCDQLDLLLTELGAVEISPDIRRAIDRHVDACDGCEERRKKAVPLAVFGGFAPVLAAPGVKGQILEGLLRQWPGPTASPEPLAPGPGGSGIPPLENAGLATVGGGGSWWSGRGARVGVLMAVAGFLGLLMLLPASPLAITRDNGGSSPPTFIVEDDTPTPPNDATGVPANVTPTPTPSETPTPDPEATETPTSVPTSTPGPGTPTAPPPTATTPATSTSTPTSTPTLTPTPTVTPTRTPTVTPTPCTPSLSASPIGISLGGNGAGSNSLTLTSLSCAAAQFTVQSPAGWITANPGSGTVQGFGQSTVTINANNPSFEGQQTFQLSIAVNGGSNVAVNVTVTRAGGQPPQIGAVCATPTGMDTWNVQATVTDDISGVQSVSVSVAGPQGTHTATLSPSGGSTWSGVLNGGTVLISAPWTFTARDGSLPNPKQTVQTYSGISVCP